MSPFGSLRESRWSNTGSRDAGPSVLGRCMSCLGSGAGTNLFCSGQSGSPHREVTFWMCSSKMTQEASLPFPPRGPPGGCLPFLVPSVTSITPPPSSTQPRNPGVKPRTCLVQLALCPIPPLLTCCPAQPRHHAMEVGQATDLALLGARAQARPVGPALPGWRDAERRAGGDGGSRT